MVTHSRAFAVAGGWVAVPLIGGGLVLLASAGPIRGDFAPMGVALVAGVLVAVILPVGLLAAAVAVTSLAGRFRSAAALGAVAGLIGLGVALAGGALYALTRWR